MQVKKIDESEWWDFVNNCPTATFFHTPDWYRVWKEYDGNNYEARLLILKSGKKVLLPLVFRPRLKRLIKEFFSGPAGTYGGILHMNDLSIQDIQHIEDYVNSFAFVQIRANPLNPVLKQSFFTNQEFTQILNLPTCVNDLTEKWSKNHARSLKKGLKNNITVRAAKAITEWKKYYLVYQDSRKRWGKAASNDYDWDLFQIISRLDANKCKLWLAFLDGEIISGCLFFYLNEHVVYWHGATLEAYLKTGPAHVLHFHIIKNAVENNFKWYDFNPSGGYEGVVKFKKGFGTKFYASNVFKKQPYIYNLNDLFRKKL